MPYTSQTKTDVEIIERVLAAATRGRDGITFLEVGTYHGDTSKEIKRWCDEHGSKLEFWGIDAGRHPDFKITEPMLLTDAVNRVPMPFPGANMVRGDSAEVFHLIPYGLDVALIDGCHCINHVILDTIHYGDRIKPGGFMMFHDTAPHIQQTMRDPHGPDIPEFYNSVLKAHTLMRFPFRNWYPAGGGCDSDAKWGGITVYQKQ